MAERRTFDRVWPVATFIELRRANLSCRDNLAATFVVTHAAGQTRVRPALAGTYVFGTGCARVTRLGRTWFANLTATRRSAASSASTASTGVFEVPINRVAGGRGYASQA